MIFIDGGYLRKQIKNLFNNDLLDFDLLKVILATSLAPKFFLFEIIRVYYYDALDNSPQPLEEIYIRSIKKLKQFEDRLGTLNVSRKTRDKSQKGVDTLIAIDMLSKAYEDQYDVAILISGDRDFSPVIDYVKNTGKRVYGIYFPKTISAELEEKLDELFEVDMNWLIDERIRKDIVIETEIKGNSKDDNLELIVKIDLLFQAQIPISLYLIKLNPEGKITATVSVDVEIDYSDSEKLAKLGRWRHEREATCRIRKKMIDNNPILLLLVSDQRRKKLQENTSFLFDFNYDYYYKEINLELNTIKKQ